MKVNYNKNLIFVLPDEFDQQERLELIEDYLDSYAEHFIYTEEQDTLYDENIHRVLGQFSYYLCTANKINEYGNAMRNDKHIIRAKKKRNNHRREMSLFESLSHSTQHNHK